MQSALKTSDYNQAGITPLPGMSANQSRRPQAYAMLKQQTMNPAPQPTAKAPAQEEDPLFAGVALTSTFEMLGEIFGTSKAKQAPAARPQQRSPYQRQWAGMVGMSGPVCA